MPCVRKCDRTAPIRWSLDEMVSPDSQARIIDAYIESLDMDKFSKRTVAKTGRPSYDSKSLYKLYIYGICEGGQRSSRGLEKLCSTNIEVMWLLGGLQPDHNTISRFQTTNKEAIKDIFDDFTGRVAPKLSNGVISVDGSKISANNAKEKNYTQNKIDDRVRNLVEKMNEVDKALEEMDANDLEDEAASALLISKAALQKSLDKYEDIQQQMKENDSSQLSLTDPDSKLMKHKNGYMVSYNVQTAVDTISHLIMNFIVTNQPTDHGLLYRTIEEILNHETYHFNNIVADNGYILEDDMFKCLEHGIIPNVIPERGEENYTIECPLVEDATANPTSTDLKEISKCLHAGVIPEIYKDVLSNAETGESKVYEDDGKIPDDWPDTSPYGTKEEMIARAKEGYFVKDPDDDCVYCPGGEMLRPKCVKRTGDTRYCNKTRCRKCPLRETCLQNTNLKWKEVDFSKDCLEKPCKPILESRGIDVKNLKPTRHNRKSRKIKVARFKFTPQKDLTSKRFSTSEHGYATIKRSMNAYYFNLRTLPKVTGEFALSCLAYNMKIARNLLGFDKMMELMKG